MSPEVVLRAFAAALFTLQAIGYLWLIWIFLRSNDAAHAQDIVIAAHMTAGLNAVVLIVDVALAWAKGRTRLLGASMMLTLPAFIASAAALLLLS
jgi:hypothetical protein